MFSVQLGDNCAIVVFSTALLETVKGCSRNQQSDPSLVVRLLCIRDTLLGRHTQVAGCQGVRVPGCQGVRYLAPSRVHPHLYCPSMSLPVHTSSFQTERWQLAQDESLSTFRLLPGISPLLDMSAKCISLSGRAGFPTNFEIPPYPVPNMAKVLIGAMVSFDIQCICLSLFQ